MTKITREQFDTLEWCVYQAEINKGGQDPRDFDQWDRWIKQARDVLKEIRSKGLHRG